ncbi:hypothetical protein BD310DRAFT_317852 [Dichomitus squalens]|uniref:Secreted protein n=1 Tax=Dichomitus squalens TaxID=114155 RepID=A0A4Q9PAN7_9APHY|nr:hypothetical protein BD310DRAFT_317852 [Dichomitus squalens]
MVFSILYNLVCRCCLSLSPAVAAKLYGSNRLAGSSGLLLTLDYLATLPVPPYRRCPRQRRDPIRDGGATGPRCPFTLEAYTFSGPPYYYSVRFVTCGRSRAVSML